MSQGNTPVASLPTGLSPADAKELFARMLLLRVFDERNVIFQRQGRTGTFPVFWGHEAIQVGAAFGIGDDGWLFPSYREWAIGLVRGMPPAGVLALARGLPVGWWDPNEWRLAPAAIPVASQVLHAVGFAWGRRLRGRPTPVVAFFGDGATSEGEFHEGMNFAALQGVPAVLLCNNNQWAISTPFSKQTEAKQLADKALGYGMRAEIVDGGDVLAVYDAVRRASAMALAGTGPTFLECRHMRAKQHATADDQTLYRSREEIERAIERDCVKAFQRTLVGMGLLTDEEVGHLRAQYEELVNHDMRRVEALPVPPASAIFEHVYAELPARLARQRDELDTSSEKS